MARLPSTKSNLNLRTDQYTNSNIGTSTMVTDQQEARVLGIPGKDGTNAGSGIYNNTDPVPYDVGGIEAGETFYDVPLEDMWEKLLYPYVQPSFTSFYLSGQSNSLEVGDSITGGSREFIWSTTYSDNINPDEIIIKENGTIIANALSNDGTEFIDIGTDIQKLSADTHIFSIESTNTDTSVSARNFTITWRWSNYYGISLNESLTTTDITNLSNNNLISSYVGTYSFAETGYKYICYPVVFGQYNSAKDVDTGFAIAMNDPVIVNVLNSKGIYEDYYVYRTTYVINSSINIILS